MSEDNIHALNLQFAKLVKLANRIEKLPRAWGTDEQLTGSEISLVEIVGDHGEQLSVTDISRLLQVTKGAVSQSLQRLENKGLTSKIDDPENRSRSIVKLTVKGKTAYSAHKHWHETMDGGFREFFAGLDSDKLDFLLDSLKRAEDFFKRALQ